MNNNTYTIKDAAHRLNLSTSALRFYEKEGMLPFQKRTSSGTRFYDENDICWLELICCLKRSGMSIDTIREFIQTCLAGSDGAEERREILLRHKAAVLHQIDLLQASLSIVDYKIDHYLEIDVFHINNSISQK